MKYILPKLEYDYKDLEPYISEEQLKVHHQKHHQAYVDGANAVFEIIKKSRQENLALDTKSVLKNLSFHVGGHVLHSLFWTNMKPDSDKIPSGNLIQAIEKEFGSFERFKIEFGQAATSVEGSGWVALTYCQKNDKFLINQIEKHNTNLYPDFKIILVLDVWEHAYYLDYKNEKNKFIDNFWNIVNWQEVERRYNNATK